MWGPKRYPVVRRVILDVKNMVVLQDLQDAANATKEEWKFSIPRHCKEVQTIFYYVKLVTLGTGMCHSLMAERAMRKLTQTVLYVQLFRACSDI